MQLLLGAQVHGAEPLAVALEACSLRLDLVPPAAGRASAFRPASSSRPAGVVSRFSAMARVISATRCTRRLVAGLRAGARLAGGRERLEGGAGGAVGLRERGLAVGEAVGGLLAPRLRGLDLGEESAPARQIGVGRLEQGLRARRRARSSRCAEVGGGRRGAAAARSVHERISPAIASRRRRRISASCTSACSAPRGLRRGGAPLGDPGALLEEAAFEVGRRARAPRAPPRASCDPRLRLRLARRQAGQALLQGGAARARARPRGARRRRGARAAASRAWRAWRAASMACVSWAAAARTAAWAASASARRRSTAARAVAGLALEVAEPVLLGEAAGRRGGRLGGGGEAVPAPEVARRARRGAGRA